MSRPLLPGPVLVAVSVLLLPSAVTLASWIPSEGTAIVTVQAQSGSDTGTLQFMFDPGTQINGRWAWLLPDGEENRTIKSGDKVLATLQGLNVVLNTDPSVALGFSLTAGSADTTFTITSTTLGFPALTDPQAYATAALAVTDNDSNGVTLTGQEPGGKSYQARYNQPAVAWANLLSAAMTSERVPAAGRQIIPGSVDRITAEFKFTLSAGDSANGTSKFDIVPEPATLVLLVVGVLLFARRRRFSLLRA